MPLIISVKHEIASKSSLKSTNCDGLMLILDIYVINKNTFSF